MFDFLPEEISSALNFIKTDKVYGLRLRAGYPVIIYYDGEEGFLYKKGFTNNRETAILCKENQIDTILKMVTEHSLYAFNEQIKNGFITTKNGVRIGLSGECVFDNGNIITIKNVTSMNIRIPHCIEGSSKDVLPYILRDNEVLDTIIISPPFCGKTTILKDLAFYLDKHMEKSILIIDERGEFAEISGTNIDKIKYSDKLYAFNYGIRSLSPDIVITDELATKTDWTCVKNAKNSGIKIIASCHADSLENLKNKEFFTDKVFLRYIVLKDYKKAGKFGQVLKVYDGGFNEL